jgi:hypothetical protein
MPAFSPRRSGRWLYAAIALFAQKPFLLCAVVLVFSLLAPLLNINPLLLQLFFPCLIAGMANLALSARPSFAEIVRPVGECWRSFAGLMVLLLCYAFLALRLFALMDPGFIHALLQPNANLLLMAETEHSAAFLRFFLLFLPFFMAQWFTPLLLVRRRYPLGKALFCNFVAIGRNWPDLLLTLLLFNLLLTGPFYLMRFITNPNLFLLLLCAFLLALTALWICLLCVLYRDFFPAESAHISEEA